MKDRRAVFVCNALEDTTRIEREIYSDSPAASKKTFQMAIALRSVGERVIVLSMGRGRPNGSGKYFPSKVGRIDGVPVIYAPFSHLPILSQCISFFSLPFILYRMKRFNGKTTTIFYNRTTAYVSALLACTLLGYSRVLDLEDGDLPFAGWSWHQIFINVKRWMYGKLCTGGTILACSTLANNNTERSEFCYYGAVSHFRVEISWKFKNQYKFLLGGTVSYDTGAKTLIDAINALRNNPEPWVDKLEFIITGKGDCIQCFEELSKIEKPPLVKVMGRLTDREYSELVLSCDVGLALKPNSGLLASTTFPSKIIELASSGLLVLTTNISDVRRVLGAGALYLDNDRLDSLLGCLRWIVENPQSAEALARAGTAAVKSHCALNTAGLKLANYVFNNEN